jgi:hypothetical protein
VTVPDPCQTSDEDEVRLALKDALARCEGSYAELARRAGVSDEYARLACIGQRPVRGSMLTYLGFEKVITYRRINPVPDP